MFGWCASFCARADAPAATNKSSSGAHGQRRAGASNPTRGERPLRGACARAIADATGLEFGLDRGQLTTAIKLNLARNQALAGSHAEAVKICREFQPQLTYEL